MKEKLLNLFHKWVVIPKYERKIKKLENEKDDLLQNLQFMQSKMYHYKNKLLENRKSKKEEDNGK